MKVLSTIIFIFLFVCGLSAQDLQRDVYSSGGTSVSTGEVIVNYTIGQNFIFNSSTAGEITVHSGFVHQQERDVILSVEDFGEGHIELFPVPVSDQLTIISNKMDWDDLQILNAEGKMLRTIFFTSRDQQTDLSDLLPGVYFLRFMKGEQVIVKTITKY